MKLDFIVNGKTYVHNERKWIVCTNRHPNTDGTPWGWVEGIAGNVTWSGRDGHKHASDVVNAHNDWIEAQEPPALKMARLVPEFQRLGKEREDLMRRVNVLVSQEEAIAVQIREIGGAP